MSKRSKRNTDTTPAIPAAIEAAIIVGAADAASVTASTPEAAAVNVGAMPTTTDTTDTTTPDTVNMTQAEVLRCMDDAAQSDDAAYFTRCAKLHNIAQPNPDTTTPDTTTPDTTTPDALPDMDGGTDYAQEHTDTTPDGIALHCKGVNAKGQGVFTVSGMPGTIVLWPEAVNAAAKGAVLVCRQLHVRKGAPTLASYAVPGISGRIHCYLPVSMLATAPEIGSTANLTLHTDNTLYTTLALSTTPTVQTKGVTALHTNTPDTTGAYDAGKGQSGGVQHTTAADIFRRIASRA